MINPKDMMEKLSVEELCLTAENYFKALSADMRSLVSKPFSSLRDAPELLENMSLLLSGLRLGKAMTVLDFGAGTCWFSRFLNQLQCQTISCDVSKTALEIGARLFEEHPIIGDYVSEPRFLHFDGHTIDVPDHSVDRIVCLDAFHHIPNPDEVMSEFARVLKEGGIAGFGEPGRFHSQAPTSQFEMRNFNILENDIDLNEIFSIAQRKGFTHISCKLLSTMEVTLDDYNTLTTDDGAGSFRAPWKSWKMTALRKSVLDNIRMATTMKSIFFLYKGEFIPDSRSHVGLAHSISIEKNEFSVMEGEDLNIALKISNTGGARWLNENINYIGVVRIGTHLYDQNNTLLNHDFSRHDLERSLSPGETIDKIITVRFSTKGTFILAVDLLSEAICWFEILGSQPRFITVEVR